MPLTRKQKWRIDKVQSEKIARADKAASKAESELDDQKDRPTEMPISQGLVKTKELFFSIHFLKEWKIRRLKRFWPMN